VCPARPALTKKSISTRAPVHWQCYKCIPSGGYRFSTLVATIFENTNILLRQWFQAIHLMLTSRKGMSALRIYRLVSFGSYKITWSMCHRIRAGMADEDCKKRIDIMEVDKIFIGGKAENRHKDKGGGGGEETGGTGSGKSVVAGAVQHKANVVARVIESVDGSHHLRLRGVALLQPDRGEQLPQFRVVRVDLQRAL
jgi:hypothetical protein